MRSKREFVELELEGPSQIGAAAAGVGLTAVALVIAILFNAFMNQPSVPQDVASIGAVSKLHVDAGDAQASAISIRVNPVVESVQRELAAAGLYDGPVDGIAGKRTRQAIEAWQATNGFAVTGEASQEIADQLAFNRTIAEASAETSSVEPAMPGDKRIAKVQAGLAELGYLPGAADGFLGNQTRDAIRQFEHDRGMPESGNVSDSLLAELGKTSGQSSVTPQ